MTPEEFDEKIDLFKRSVRRGMELRVEVRALNKHLTELNLTFERLRKYEQDPRRLELLDLVHEILYLMGKNLASEEVMSLVLDFRDLTSGTKRRKTSSTE
jgi:hypothetical protein